MKKFFEYKAYDRQGNLTAHGVLTDLNIDNPDPGLAFHLIPHESYPDRNAYTITSRLITEVEFAAFIAVHSGKQRKL